MSRKPFEIRGKCSINERKAGRYQRSDLSKQIASGKGDANMSVAGNISLQLDSANCFVQVAQ